MADSIRQLEAENEVEKPYDASDPKQVNTARKKASRKLSEKLEFVKAMMELTQGRKYLWDLMESCNMFTSPLVDGDTHSTYFKLGQQNIGKLLLMDTMTFSDLYVKMVEENK